MGTENETESTNAPPVIDANTVEVPPSKKKRTEATDNANWVRENNAEQGIPQEDAHLKGRRDYRDGNVAAKRALEEQKENMKIRGITKPEVLPGTPKGAPRDVGKNDFKVPKGEAEVDETELAAVRERFNKLTTEAPKKASPTKRVSPEKQIDLGLETDSTEEEKETRRANEREEKRIRDNFKAGRSSLPDSYSTDSTGETESAKLRRLAAEKQKREVDEADKKKKAPITSKPKDINKDIKTPDTKSPIKPLKTAAELAKEADAASPGMRIDASGTLTPAELAEIAAETEGVEKIKTRINGITSPTSRERGDLISTVDDLKKKREGLQKKYADKSREKAFQSLISRINEVESLADEKLNGKASPSKRTGKESYTEKQAREEAEKKLVRDAKSPIDTTIDQRYGEHIGVEPTSTGKDLQKYIGKDGKPYYVNHDGELVDKDGKKIDETPSTKRRREEAQEAQKAAKSTESATGNIKDKLIKTIDNVDIPNPFTGTSHPKYGTLLGTNKSNGADINMYSDGTKDGVYFTNGANDRVTVDGVPITESVEDKEKRIKAQTLVQKEAENKKSTTQHVKGAMSYINGWVGKRGENINKHMEGENRAAKEQMNRTKASLIGGASGSSSSGSSNSLSETGKKRLRDLQERKAKCERHGGVGDNRRYRL